MLEMVNYESIRKKYAVEQLSIKEICRGTGHSRRTVRKVLRAGSVRVPKYNLTVDKPCPVMDPYKPVIAAWLEADEDAPRKQRHTARRIYQRLVKEYGFMGSERSVGRWVRTLKTRPREVFLMLEADLGEQAQVDWGKARVVLGGIETDVCIFVLRMRNSGVVFAWASHTERLEAFLEGHVRAFEWLGGVPRVCVYDNLRTAVLKVLAGPVREEHQKFSALRAHFLFDSEFCAPGKGNEKGSVENGVGYVRRSALVPVPDLSGIEELNDLLLSWCEGDRDRLSEGWALESRELRALPVGSFNCSSERLVVVNKLALVTVDRGRYSVPSRLVGETVRVEVAATLVEVFHKDRLVATHFRNFGPNHTELRLDHYLDALKHKPRAVKNASVVRRLPEVFQEARRRLCDTNPHGYREFCAILMLHREYELAEVQDALGAAMSAGTLTAEAVEQVLIARPTPPIEAAAVPAALRGIESIQPSPASYNTLMEAAS